MTLFQTLSLPPNDFELLYWVQSLKHWLIEVFILALLLGFSIELQALLFFLALVVRAANKPVEYDSDDELIAPRQQIRQPLINRPPLPPAAGVPVAGPLDQRPGRSDAWSARMREKV